MTREIVSDENREPGGDAGAGTPQGGARPTFWSYLRTREVDHLPSGALRWWLLALIVLGWAVEQYEGLKTGPVLVYVLKDFGKTLTDWGYIAALGGIVYSVGAATLSRVADRFGRRPLMVSAVFCYALISVAGALAPSFWVLALLGWSASFMVAGMSPAVHAASRDLTPRMGRAMVYSWVSLAFTVGALMSTAIAARTLPIWPGWRSQYWIGATLATITALVLFVFYRDLAAHVRGRVFEHTQPAAEPPQPLVMPSYDEGRRVYRAPRLWLLSFVIVFWSLTYVSVSGYVPTMLAQHYHLEPARAAGVTSYFWMVFTCSVFLSGWLSDRLRVRKTVTAFGGVTTGISFIVGAHMPLDTPPATLALVWSLTGFFAGFIYPAWCAIYSETAESVSPHGVGRAFGITGTLGPIAGLFLNLGLPRVVANFGWPTWMTIAGFCCFGVALLVSSGEGPWWVATRSWRRAISKPVPAD